MHGGMPALLALLAALLAAVLAPGAYSLPPANATSTVGSKQGPKTTTTTHPSVAKEPPPSIKPMVFALDGFQANDEDEDAGVDLPLDKAATQNFQTMMELLKRGNKTRIVGGEDTRISEFPHQVAWLHNGGLRCGAAILSADWLISAAHCFPNKDETMGNTFRVGSSTAAEGGQVVRAAGFHRHPQWSMTTMDWDLGLVKVDPPIDLGSDAKVIKLVDSDMKLHKRDALTVTGWGLTQEKGESYDYGGSYNLQKVDVHVVNHKRCSNAYKKVHMAVSDHMLCAQAPHKDACQGDSGGPLVIGDGDSMRLLGLVSWGSGCAQDKFPGVYTDLRHPGHRQFIESVTGLKP